MEIIKIYKDNKLYKIFWNLVNIKKEIKMMSKILLKICSLFPKSKLGILISIMFTKASSVVIKDILDPENQKKAYEFVK